MQDKKQPANMESSKSAEGDQRRGRWILVFLFLFFAVPIVIVMLLQHYDWHPSTGHSYGEFVSPVQKIKMQETLLDANGQSITAKFFLDKWSMVYIADDCQETCKDRLHNMRQLHVSFGKDSNRLQRVFITASVKVAELQKQYPDLVIINQPTAELVNLSHQFDIAGVTAKKDDRIYLVDPLGNLMMSFSSVITPAEIRKDIDRLLKYSWAG